LASSSRASKLELASLYEQQGDPGATASIMRALGDLAPDNVDVLFMAQRVYSELADETLNKLAVLAPGSARMQEIIAQHLINQGIKGTSKAPLITTARHCRSIYERPAFTTNWETPSSNPFAVMLLRKPKLKRNWSRL
jgi:hypothetical protein